MFATPSDLLRPESLEFDSLRVAAVTLAELQGFLDVPSLVRAFCTTCDLSESAATAMANIIVRDVDVLQFVPADLELELA